MNIHVQPRYLWLIFYLLLNIGYTVAILANHHLFGESQNVVLNPNTPVTVIGFLVCASYVVIPGLGFRAAEHLVQPQIAIRDESSSWTAQLGPIVMALQLLFMVYFLVTGTYVAGSTAREASVLSAAWVLVPIDMIFFVYYGISSNGAWSRCNLVVWVASSLLRGWMGGLLTVLFIESCKAIRKGTLRPKILVICILALVALYPPLYFAKLFYRFAGTEGLMQFLTTFSWEEVTRTFESLDLSDGLVQAFQQILNRLQIISSAVAIHQAEPVLQPALAAGLVFPAWLEGLHGLAIFRTLGVTAPLDLGQAFAMYIDPYSFETSWNSNPTFVGYFLVSSFPEWLGIAVYSAALCLSSIALMRLLKWDENTKDVLWYAWLVYLVPGWFGAFFLFVYSLLLLVFLKTFLQLLGNVRSRAQPC